jgi:hypothetical protein
LAFIPRIGKGFVRGLRIGFGTISRGKVGLIVTATGGRLTNLRALRSGRYSKIPIEVCDAASAIHHPRSASQVAP